MHARKISVGLATLALIAAACSGGGATGAPSAATSAEPSAAASGVPSESASAGPVLPTEVGPGEGQPGTSRSGPTTWSVGPAANRSPGAPDWVTPFEQKTGCKVNAKVSGGSSDGVALDEDRRIDGGSFSGDATLRLIAGGDVAPVNTALIPNYANVFEGLKGKKPQHSGRRPRRSPARPRRERPHVAVGHRPARPGQLERRLGRRQPVRRQGVGLRLQDLHRRRCRLLMATKPELGIEDPYALDATQFQAAVDLLKAQRQNITTYWSAVRSTGRRVHQGRHGRQPPRGRPQVNTLEGGQGADQVHACRRRAAPAGPTPGWSPREAKNPNCMYMWMDYIISPVANATATVLLR